MRNFGGRYTEVSVEGTHSQMRILIIGVLAVYLVPRYLVCVINFVGGRQSKGQTAVSCSKVACLAACRALLPVHRQAVLYNTAVP